MISVAPAAKMTRAAKASSAQAIYQTMSSTTLMMEASEPWPIVFMPAPSRFANEACGRLPDRQASPVLSNHAATGAIA